MAQSAPATAVEGGGQSKLDQIKEKIVFVFSYERLLIVDAILAGIHFLALLVLAWQYLMFVTLLGLRAPRSVFHLIAKKTNSAEWFDREMLFRKWSTYLYFPIAIITQALTMVTNFCRDSGNPSECRSGYMWTMFILLVLYMPLDIVLFLSVKKTYEERAANMPAGAGGRQPEIEMKAHNMA